MAGRRPAVSSAEREPHRRWRSQRADRVRRRSVGRSSPARSVGPLVWWGALQHRRSRRYLLGRDAPLQRRAAMGNPRGLLGPGASARCRERHVPRVVRQQPRRRPGARRAPHHASPPGARRSGRQRFRSPVRVVQARRVARGLHGRRRRRTHRRGARQLAAAPLLARHLSKRDAPRRRRRGRHNEYRSGVERNLAGSTHGGSPRSSRM